jgi:hypothetical protein
MLSYNHTKKISALLLSLSISTFAVASPFTVSITDTLDVSDQEEQFFNGEPITIAIVLDNGGTTPNSQTWTSTDVVSVTFIMNDAPNTVTTVFSGPFDENAGDFVTDADGKLTAVPTAWLDESVNVISTNDPFTPTYWYINSFNGVYYNAQWNSAGMTTVVNTRDPDSWTDPVSPAASATPASATPVPTMSAYGLVLTMLGLLVAAGRRLRASAKLS